MKQRLFALLLVVALLVTTAFVAFPASAEGETDTTVTATGKNAVYAAATQMTADGVFDEENQDENGVVKATCPYCGGTDEKDWYPITSSSGSKVLTSLTGSHHYYLAEDLNVTTHYAVGTDGAATQLDLCLHLNGKDIISTNRALFVSNRAVLNLMGDGVISGGYKGSYIRFGATLDVTGHANLCGGTFLRTETTRPIIGLRGSNKYMTTGATVYDGTVIEGAGVESTASLIYLYNSTNTLTVAGGYIQNGYYSSNNGGNIYSQGCPVVITGGTIQNGRARRGGNIILATATVNSKTVYSSLNMSGGSILNGYASGEGGINAGGNIAAFTGCDVTITGGKVSGGVTGENGGNIYCNALTVGGTALITKGSAANSDMNDYDGGLGANVLLYGTSSTPAKLTMTGGQIDGDIDFYNTPKNAEAGYAVVTLSGAAKIGLGNSDGLDLAYDTQVTETVDTETVTTTVTDGGTIAVNASGLTAGAEIYVNSNGAFTGENTTDISGYFKPALRTGAITRDEATGVLSAVQVASGELGGYCPHCDKQVTWTALDPSSANISIAAADFTTDAHYYVTASVTSTGKSRILQFGTSGMDNTQEVTLDLNGCSLTALAGYGTLRSYCGFSILDSVGTAVATASANTTGTSGAAIMAEGLIRIYGGAFKNVNSTTTGQGGCVYARNDIEMYGGLIDASGCHTDTKNGAALFTNAGYTTIYNGLIFGGTAANGGGIYHNSEESFTMSGGAIIGGHALTSGGALYVRGAAQITGGIIQDGESDAAGGNVYTTKMVTFENAIISGGTAGTYGGNLYLGASAAGLTMNSGVIAGGTATNRGGNLYSASYGTTTTISDGLIIGGTAETGGNAYFGNGYCTMTGGRILYGTATQNAGNIYSSVGNVDTITNDNYVQYADAGLFIHSDADSTPVIKGGEAGNNGGNIYNVGHMVLNGANVSGGIAVNKGADLYMTKPSEDKNDVAEAASVIGANQTGTLYVNSSYLGSPVYGSDIAATKCEAMNAELVLILDGEYGEPLVTRNETTNKLTVQGGGLALVNSEGEATFYADPADAIANYSDGMVLRVAGAETVELASGTYTVDMYGQDATISGGATVNGIDTKNDTYKAANCGTATLSGVTLATNCYEIDGGWYIAVAGETEGTYTFHRLEMAITSVSIRPSAAGIYYWAQWDCDSTLAELVDTYGIATSLTQLKEGFDITGTLYTELTKANFTACEEQTGALMTGMVMVPDERTAEVEEGYNSLNDMYGKTPIYAVPYIWLSVDGETIKLDGVDSQVSYSLHDLVQMVDAAVAGYTDDVYFTAMDTFATTWADANLGWTYTNYATQLAAKEAAEAESTT